MKKLKCPNCRRMIKPERTSKMKDSEKTYMCGLCAWGFTDLEAGIKPKKKKKVIV